MNAFTTNLPNIATAADIDQIPARNDFARQAARDAFGPRHYIHPADRDFKDLLPGKWVGEAAINVLQTTAARMAIQNVLRRPKNGGVV